MAAEQNQTTGPQSFELVPVQSRRLWRGGIPHKNLFGIGCTDDQMPAIPEFGDCWGRRPRQPGPIGIERSRLQIQELGGTQDLIGRERAICSAELMAQADRVDGNPVKSGNEDNRGEAGIYCGAILRSSSADDGGQISQSSPTSGVNPAAHDAGELRARLATCTCPSPRVWSRCS